MNQQIGKVIEVFVPTNDDSLDVMTSDKIGFKVQLDNEEVIIIQEQNEFNVEIFKNDLVIITKQNISGKDFVNIELDEGDDYGQ